MTPERLRQVEELFHAARESPPQERAALLAAADPEVCREAQSLLAQQGNPLVPPERFSPETRTRLSAGAQLGPYTIEGALGAGGMGEVYRARDTRLNRSVAIKVSSSQFSDRFEREARAIAALTHPHICTLYDVGPNYLVMELVEGETLAARLGKGKLSLDMAIQYGAQIAQALAEAHAKGITHRDVKPGNIMLTKSGVKVLDFGLAKSVQDETVTAANAVMGTPAYMAPEQRSGKTCDARTDVYALGLVMYEMATGRRASESELRPLEPALLDQVVKTCLAPDPGDRWQTAREFQIALRPLLSEEKWTAPARARRGRWWAAGIAVLALGAAFGGWALVHFRQQSFEESALRLPLFPPDGGRFMMTGDKGGMALSPDGRLAVYYARLNGKAALWIQPLAGGVARPLAGTENAAQPFWSPDSKSVAFFTVTKLQRIEVAGGEPWTICETQGPGAGGAWSSDGEILFGLFNSPLFKVSASGGTPAQFTKLDAAHGETGQYWPQILPGGRLLYWVKNKTPQNSAVYATSVAQPGARVRLVTSDANAIYANGHLLWLQGTVLVAQDFDATSLNLTGEPHPVADPVAKLAVSGHTLASVSNHGVLLYNAYDILSLNQMIWFDRTGRRLEVVGERDAYSTFRLSPEGRRAVASVSKSDGADLWLLDVPGGLRSRFTANSKVNVFPGWSPDGRTILFTSTRELYSKDSGGAGDERLFMPSDSPQMIMDWSRDGRVILYSENAPDTQFDLWSLPVTADGGKGKPTPYLRTRFNEYYARLLPENSPRWVAYESDESGRYEVYIQAFPEPRGKVRISTEGGRYPQWEPHSGKDRGELLYMSLDLKLMSVNLKIGTDSVVPSVPRELFALPVISPGVSPYDVAPDGQHFLVRAQEQSALPLTVIANWPALLKK